MTGIQLSTINKGIKITDAEMQALAIKKDDALPKWNYEIRPN